MRASHALVRVLMVCLCLCIFMQVLGAPNTLWDTTMVEDAPDVSILMAVSLPSRGIPFGARDTRNPWIDHSRLLFDRLADNDHFRPPCA